MKIGRLVINLGLLPKKATIREEIAEVKKGHKWIDGELRKLKTSDLMHHDRLEIVEKSFDLMEVTFKKDIKNNVAWLNTHEEAIETIQIEIKQMQTVIATMAKVLDGIVKK